MWVPSPPVCAPSPSVRRGAPCACPPRLCAPSPSVRRGTPCACPPRLCAPSPSVRRGAPCGCPPRLCAPSPSVRRGTPCACPPRLCAPSPSVRRGTPCGCPPRGLDSIDETSTLFLLPCIGSSVSLQKRVKLLPLLVGSSINRHPTIVANLSVLNKRQRALKTQNQKLKTTHTYPSRSSTRRSAARIFSWRIAVVRSPRVLSRTLRSTSVCRRSPPVTASGKSTVTSNE